MIFSSISCMDQSIFPIMPALCSMLWHAYYAKNYAGIIGASLIMKAT